MAEGNKVKKSKYFDYLLLFVVMFLLGFGLVMIYSSSAYTASLKHNGDGLYFLKRQLVSTVVGLAAMFIVSFIPVTLYKKLSVFIYIFSVLAVGLVLTGLGVESHGARRWIYIGPLSIQPAEIAKIAIIIVVAVLFDKMTKKEASSWKGVYIPLAPAALLSVIILLLTNNLSSALIVAGIAFCMVAIMQGKNYRPYVVLGIVALLGGLMVLAIAKGWGAGVIGFRGVRILAWLDPESYADGKGFQTIQSLYGIGSGGAWGKGLGKSMQKLAFLPEPHNDMIFSIICEELGIFGGLSVMVLFVILLWRIVDISTHIEDTYENMILAGVFSHIAIQVILNIAVVTNTIPNTGISLPFISYGGSSVIFLLIEIGMVLRISRNCVFSSPRKAPKLMPDMPEEE